MSSKSAAGVMMRVFLAATLIAPWHGGCAGPTAPTVDAPDIPPVETFVIDFGDFDAGVAKAQNQRTAQAVPGGNWLFAAGSVAVWNILLTVTLAVPVAAFVESFNHQPVLQDDGSFAWSYDVNVAGVMHSARLEARGAGANIEWSMFLTKDGEFSNVLWFTGESNLLGTAGTWTLNRDPDNLEPFIRIDWTRDPSSGTGDIRYTNIVPNGPENGGFIFAARTNDDPFDRSYQIFNAGDDRTTSIEWHHLNKDGRVMDEVQFGDSEYRCWDTALQDAECVE